MGLFAGSHLHVPPAKHEVKHRSSAASDTQPRLREKSGGYGSQGVPVQRDPLLRKRGSGCVQVPADVQPGLLQAPLGPPAEEICVGGNGRILRIGSV